MTELKKHQVLLLVVVCIFIYALCTEVYDRYNLMFQTYTSFVEKEKTVYKPEEMNERRIELRAQKNLLTMQLLKGKGQYEQNQVGIINLINNRANDRGIAVNSFAPLESKPIGQMTEIGFRLEVVGTYHRIGKFLNDLETSSIPVHIRKMEIQSQQAGSTTIEGKVEGSAFVLAQSSAK